MIGWAIETLIATAALMLLALILREPVRRSFGSSVAYALWLLPAARLAMPQLAGSSQLSRLVEPIARQAAQDPGFVAGVLDPATLSPTIAQHATIAGVEIGTHHAQVAFVPPTAVEGGPHVLAILLGLWAIGAIGFLGYYVLAHLRFRHRLLRGARSQGIVAGSVRVIESDAAHGPLAFGVWRKYVAFPRDFAERYDADEREFALLHEIGHHHRGDLIANWIALALLAMHWFNPLAWRAYRAFRADQEMANDARVLAGRSAVERHAYACAIVKAAHPAFGAVSATCNLNTIKDLKGRLKMLTTGRRSRARLAMGGAAVAALTIAGLGLTASGTAAANTVRAGVEKATGVDFAKLDAKLQDAPPAPPAPAAGNHRRIVIVKDGKRTEYEGADADAYIAAHPEMAPPAPPAVAERAMPPAPPAAPGSVRRYKIVRVGKDGNSVSEDWNGSPGAPLPPGMADVPEVRSANCAHAADEDREMVIHRNQGDKQIIVICENRIQRVAARGAAVAAQSQDIERRAYAQALTGLRAARARIAADPSMSGEARSEALAGIDESIKELESDLAHAGRD